MSENRTVLRGRDALRDALALLIDQAHRSVALCAPTLPPELFNTVAFSRALASFAARHRQNQARILLGDVAQAMRDNDRVVGLARRLSDTVGVREFSEDDRGVRELLLLVDQRAFIQLTDPDETQALACDGGGPLVAETYARLDAMWQRSLPIGAIQPVGL